MSLQPPLERFLAAALRPVNALRLFFHRSDASGDVYPTDTPDGSVGGDSPLRLILIGERGQISLGVVSHEIGNAGFAARKLAESAGVGVTWSIVNVRSDRIRDLRPTIVAREQDLSDVDAVVILMGITDALALTPSKTWERHLDDTLATLRLRMPPSAVIAVAEIPPLDNAGSLIRPARVAAGARASTLNESTGEVVARFDRAITVPFPEELTRDLWMPRSEETKYIDTYQVWGAAIANAVEAALDQAR